MVRFADHPAALEMTEQGGCHSIVQPLHHFRRRRSYFKFHQLLSQVGMRSRQAHVPGLLFSADPNCAGAADQSKWIIADDLRRTIDVQLYCVIGKRLNRSEFICDAEDDASGVRTVRY